MAITHELTALTRRRFDGVVQRLHAVDGIANGLAIAFLREMRPTDIRTGPLGLGWEVIVRTRAANGSWYKGFSKVTSDQPPMDRAGVVIPYFRTTTIAIAHTELRQNVGVGIDDLEGDLPLKVVMAGNETALANLLGERIEEGRETAFDVWSDGIHNGGKDADGAPDPLGMQGLNTLFDENMPFAQIGPAQLQEFADDDPWVTKSIGQTSKNLWEPTIFDNGGSDRVIGYSLMKNIILKTQRWGGRRVCELDQELYDVLEGDFASLYRVDVDRDMASFGIPNFRIHDVTFTPGLRSPSGKARIVNLRYCRPKFGLPSGRQQMQIPRAEEQGVAMFPSYTSAFRIAGEQRALKGGVEFETALYCDNRRAQIEIRDLKSA